MPTRMPLMVLIAATIALALATTSLAADPPPHPNVLVILSDDHGYGDVGFNGCTDIPMPNLDRLAASGVRCSQGYVSHPFCSPTRAGLLTGRYQHRFGHENNPFYDPNDAREGLPLTERPFPEYLKAADYTTGWIGKWHLGATPAHKPFNRGFTDTFGFIGGGHRYLDWKVNPAVEYLVPIERNGVAVDEKEHVTVAFGREAAAFVRRNAERPWFLYLAFNAPHAPVTPTPERLARFASIANPKRRAYAAQVSLLDDAVGTVLDALSASGQDTRTLVFFFSDNGGPLEINGSNNGPLRGAKGSVYEGGIHVPFVVRWPGTLPAGAVYDRPVSSLDVMATSLAAAGLDMPADKPYDSVNLLPYLRGEKPPSSLPHDRLFWRTTSGLSAVRDGDWKLVRKSNQPSELYDLANDLPETKNAASAEPATAARLAAALDAWNRQMIGPAFPGAPGKKRAGAASSPATPD